jgi:hypothetical protein
MLRQRTARPRKVEGLDGMTKARNGTGKRQALKTNPLGKDTPRIAQIPSDKPRDASSSPITMEQHFISAHNSDNYGREEQHMTAHSRSKERVHAIEVLVGLCLPEPVEKVVETEVIHG